MIPENDPAWVPSGTERRRLPRLAASDAAARIAWKAEGVRVYKAAARLIDITSLGAGFVALRPAEPGGVLWLGMASLPWEWVKVTIRAAVQGAHEWRYHVAFCEPCPPGLLEQAISPLPGFEELPTAILSAADDGDETLLPSLHLC
jgi:hypothetical protein